jgi:hypothetical protein
MIVFVQMSGTFYKLLMLNVCNCYGIPHSLASKCLKMYIILGYKADALTSKYISERKPERVTATGNVKARNVGEGRQAG